MHIQTLLWLAGIRWATQDNQIISNHCNSFAKSAGSLFSCIYLHAIGKLNPKHTLENLHIPSFACYIHPHVIQYSAFQNDSLCCHLKIQRKPIKH